MGFLHFSRPKWREKTLTRVRFNGRTFPFLILFIVSLLLLSILIWFSSEQSFKSSLFNSKNVKSRFPQCKFTGQSSRTTVDRTLNLLPNGEKYIWFAPHSGFSNQLSELKNALLMAVILNRTLIVPPILDHHAVALGSCPKFRVRSPTELRISVWNHIIQLIQDHRYSSIADIVDLSSVVSTSLVKTIDFRVFISLWCGINIDQACFGNLCCAMSEIGSLWGDVKQCGSLLSSLEVNLEQCVYGVEEDCRTTVWTYQQNNHEHLDSFQPSERLRKEKKITYVRKRKDVLVAFGPGTDAGRATVLSFGSLFSSPYKGSELYIDIHEAPNDIRVHSLLKKIEFLPFVPEIINAGKGYALNRIKVPFLCAQLRLLDGQFKNHWKATFSVLEEKIQYLQMQHKGKDNMIHIFIMTDLPSANWTGYYLGDLASDSKSYKLFNLQEGDELVVKTAEKLMAAEHGLRSGFFQRTHYITSKNRRCLPVLLPDILLYVEETICSCASLGFVGTSGSTIATSIELMRKNNICIHPNRPQL